MAEKRKIWIYADDGLRKNLEFTDIISAYCEDEQGIFGGGEVSQCKHYLSVGRSCGLLIARDTETFWKSRCAFSIYYNSVIKLGKSYYQREAPSSNKSLRLDLDDMPDFKFEAVQQRLKKSSPSMPNLAEWENYVNTTVKREFEKIFSEQYLVGESKTCGSCAHLSEMKPWICDITERMRERWQSRRACEHYTLQKRYSPLAKEHWCGSCKHLSRSSSYLCMKPDEGSDEPIYEARNRTQKYKDCPKYLRKVLVQSCISLSLSPEEEQAERGDHRDRIYYREEKNAEKIDSQDRENLNEFEQHKRHPVDRAVALLVKHELSLLEERITLALPNSEYRRSCELQYELFLSRLQNPDGPLTADMKAELENMKEFFARPYRDLRHLQPSLRRELHELGKRAEEAKSESKHSKMYRRQFEIHLKCLKEGFTKQELLKASFEERLREGMTEKEKSNALSAARKDVERNMKEIDTFLTQKMCELDKAEACNSLQEEQS